MQMRSRWIRSPNVSARPHGIESVTGVILHWTATPHKTGLAVANYFAKDSTDLSAHDVVDANGYDYRCVPYHLAAWHAKDQNPTTNGIEIVNRGFPHEDWPDGQIWAVAMIIRRMDRECPNLKLRAVTDHQHVSADGKVDLDRQFPAAKLFWWIIHPQDENPPRMCYDHLPEWARQNCREIWKN
jgi:N-acetyl-anhydromuramyl-L-alanine amidase AmpD